MLAQRLKKRRNHGTSRHKIGDVGAGEEFQELRQKILVNRSPVW
jgi:hypothetical protein